jgi:hypothetical protein
MRPLLAKFTSRKFLMALVAALAAFLKALYPDFPDEALQTVLYACLGYVAVEGGIDALSVVLKWFTQKRDW